DYFPKRSGCLVHESIHYWQQLSQGYLFQLAQEDWTQMLAWEQKSGSAVLGPRRSHYYKAEGRYGFSAYQLCESFARFWEVVFVGPVATMEEARKNGRASTHVWSEWEDLVRHGLSDKAFDMSMRVSGSYDLPYAVARKVLDPTAGLVIFP